MTCLTGIFNNRELAVGIWIVAVILFSLSRSDLRKSLWPVLKVFFAPKLLLFFGTIASSVAVLCWWLKQIGLWSTDQMPATILWFTIAGSTMAVRALQAKEDEGYFRGLFKGSIRLGGVFEFIVVAQSFALLAELVLVPVIFLLGSALIMSESKPEHAKVKTLLEFVLATIVIVLLWNSVSQILDEPEQFFTTDTGRNFILPILLTIGCLPVFYVWYCYSHIEEARIQIDRKTFQTDEVKAYARKRFFLVFMARPWLLRRATRQFHSMPAKTKEDVTKIVNAIYKYEREADAPPQIDPSLGWCPYLTRDLLTDFGLRTNDYHQGYGEEYWAESGYVDLDDKILPNKVVFYLEGGEGLVRQLKITGKFMDDFMEDESLQQFRIIAQALCDRALSRHKLNFQLLLPSLSPFEQTDIVDGTKVKTWAERYPSGKGIEIFLTLSR